MWTLRRGRSREQAGGPPTRLLYDAPFARAAARWRPPRPFGPPMRQARIDRKTAETHIRARVDLDGTGASRIATGLRFLDHMLEQLARHALVDIELDGAGDLDIDGHHTTEDTGIVLGAAVAEALGDRRGIRRFAASLTAMDECLTRVALDVSGRPFLVWRVPVPAQRLGAMETELFQEWFRAFAQHAGITLHVENLYGVNSHHIVESCFKGLARALRDAVEIDPRQAARIPSTKGTLGAA